MGDQDSVDKLKEMWAFNMPCVLLVNGASYWSTIKPIYDTIYKDLQLCVKRSFAASLIDICKLHLDQDFMLEVVSYYLSSDLEELKQKITPNLVEFVSLYPPDT